MLWLFFPQSAFLTDCTTTPRLLQWLTRCCLSIRPELTLLTVAGSPQWREPSCHCIHISPPHSDKTHCCTTAVEETHARCDSYLMQKDTRWQKGQETEVGYKHARFQTAQTNTSEKVQKKNKSVAPFHSSWYLTTGCGHWVFIKNRRTLKYQLDSLIVDCASSSENQGYKCVLPEQRNHAYDAHRPGGTTVRGQKFLSLRDKKK